MLSSPRVRRFILMRSATLAVLGAMGLVALTVTRAMSPGNVGMFSWFVDLVVHWQNLLTLLLVVGILGATWAARRHWPMLLLPLAALPYIGLSTTAQHDTDGLPELRVVAANVNLHNESARQLLAWALEQKADVLVLQEVSSRYAQTLSLADRWPYRAIFPEDSPFGMAILSRHALVEVVRPASAFGPKSIRMVVQHPGADIQLVSMHPMPPLSPEDLADRDAMIAAAATPMANAGNAPALIVGDLNATIWSAPLRELNKKGWISATGWRGTWPSALPTWLGIGIDHVLASPQWGAKAVRELRIGPSFDSDHSATFVRLTLPGKPGRAPAINSSAALPPIAVTN